MEKYKGVVCMGRDKSRKFLVKYEGYGPNGYFWHELTKDQTTAKRLAELVKILQSDPYNMDAAREEALLTSIYEGTPEWINDMVEKATFYINPNQIQSNINNGAKKVKDGKASYWNKISNNIMILTDNKHGIPVKGKVELDRRHVVINKARIIRNRMTCKNFKCEFVMEVFDETIPKHALLSAIENGGELFGIGDGHAKQPFGRFRVAGFDLIK